MSDTILATISAFRGLIRHVSQVPRNDAVATACGCLAHENYSRRRGRNACGIAQQIVLQAHVFPLHKVNRDTVSSELVLGMAHSSLSDLDLFGMRRVAVNVISDTEKCRIGEKLLNSESQRFIIHKIILYVNMKHT